jgi:glycosyltransferase involved in cell wall biosynthesis
VQALIFSIEHQRQPMNFGKAVIVGCLKNSAIFLPKVIQNFELIASLFDEVAFIFIENDSIDQTKQLINEWGRKYPRFKLYSLDGLDAYESNRTMRLEIARNAYINAIQQDSDLHGFEHVIVMDMDDRGAFPIRHEDLTEALNFLRQQKNRAAVFANQSVKYYDLWALRHPQLCPFDFWHEVLKKALELGTDQEAFDAVYAGMPKRIPTDSPPIQVESAFGGLGIYKMNFILNNKSRYIGHEFKYFINDGIIFSKLQTCEHVSFHQGISAQNGDMFILPFLVNSDQDTSFNPSAYRSMIVKNTSENL